METSTTESHMLPTPVLPTRAQKNVFGMVAAAYLAVTLHNLAVLGLGGLSEVPMFLFGLCQWTPAVLVLLFQQSYIPRLKALLTQGASLNILAATYGMTVVTLSTCILMAMVFEKIHFPYGDEMIQSYPLKAFVPAALLTPEYFWAFVLIGGPLLHLVNAAGEEILWRGFLLDEMLKAFSIRTVYWLNGVFWGLWHTSMIVFLNWDFPGHPVAGVIAITASQIAWSMMLVHLRLKTKSLWPVIFSHAVANAMTIGFYDRMVDHDYNLLFSPWGLTGGACMVVFAFLTIKTFKGSHQEAAC